MRQPRVFSQGDCACNHGSRLVRLASSGPSVIKHSLVHKEQFVLHVDSAPRRGKADQPDAQQVRHARQPFRLRWTRSRFGRLPTPLPRAPTSLCLKLAMAHGCLTCAFPRPLARDAQLGSAAHLGQNRCARRSAGASRSIHVRSTPHSWMRLNRAQTSCGDRFLSYMYSSRLRMRL